MTERRCSVDGCDSPPWGRGLCRKHLNRLYRTGTVELRPRRPYQVREALAANHRVTAEGCWEWTRSRNRGGYGLAYDGERGQLAHRLAYQEFVGPIPEGLTLDHLCRNRACINPDHLEPVTLAENTRRGKRSALRDWPTHCQNGHPWDEANTYWYRGVRRCRGCAAIRNRRHRAKQRQEREQMREAS